MGLSDQIFGAKSGGKYRTPTPARRLTYPKSFEEQVEFTVHLCTLGRYRRHFGEGIIQVLVEQLSTSQRLLLIAGEDHPCMTWENVTIWSSIRRPCAHMQMYDMNEPERSLRQKIDGACGTST